ncbi:M48 family metalloprotease [Streptomyces sp. ME18-1-4]|uniref:M48 family metalloprotease n=1 Tax=Streptomyces sp. ME18-1-4 TaxID=3028685 RepID=UPI0029B6F50A|nr:M48 family metalloprotease [Streptomyces sp. ME18-1-4]MDX3240339.1 M48 family metalloprotease [Streptomyces sp. ME18-1-4]
MRVDVYTPFLLSLLLAGVCPLIGGRVAPALAARVLACASAVSAMATTWSLLLLAATLLDEAPLAVADAHEDGRWPPEPVPEVVAFAACALLLVVAYRLFRAARTEYLTRRAMRLLCAGQPPDTELIVAVSSAPMAFAIPGSTGSPGRILVTSTMLAALSAEERRVLLAHERAHLTHRHARLCTAVTLAAAANPLLAPVRHMVAFLLERWADERAAEVVGDRASTARALARAALTAGCREPSNGLGFTDRAVTRRIAALQADPPPQLWALATTVLALGALTALGALDATGDLLRLLEPVLA